MADEQLIKPRELPAATTVFADDAIMTDNGSVVGKATPVQIVNAGAPVPTEAEAIAGADNSKRMTPLTVKQVLDNVTAPSVLRAQAWAESDSPPNPGIPDSMSAKSWASEAGASADRAELFGPLTFPSITSMLDSSTVDASKIGKTVGTQDGLSANVVESGTGFINHPVTGVGLILNPSSGEYLFSSFGAVGGQICDAALDAAWSKLPPGATLRIDRSHNGEPYILDYSRPPRTTSLHVIGDEGHQFKLADQSSIFHDASETENRDLFPFAASDCSAIGINLDLNSPNNYREVGGVRYYSENSTRVNGIIFYGSLGGGAIRNLVARRNKVVRPIWTAISMFGRMSNEDDEYFYDDDFGIDGFEVIENMVSGGQQSVIYMGGGVRNGRVRDNRGVDCYYDWIRCYRQCLNIDIGHNDYILRAGAITNALWIKTGDVPWRQGVRIGHEGSAPGTCHDIRVHHNSMVIRDDDLSQSNPTDQALIRVGTGNRNVIVDFNYLRPGVMFNGINHVGAGADCFTSDNVIDCDDITPFGIRYASSTERNTLERNKIRRPRDYCFDLANCEYLLLDENECVKGATSLGVIRGNTSAQNNITRTTRLVGFTYAEMPDDADTRGKNQFEEEVVKHYSATNALDVPFDASFSEVEIRFTGVYGAGGGELRIGFYDSSGNTLASSVFSHIRRRAASTDTETVTRATGQDYADVMTIGTSSSVPSEGLIEVGRRGRVSGTIMSARRISGGADGVSGLFSCNADGAAGVRLTTTNADLRGHFSVTQRRLL